MKKRTWYGLIAAILLLIIIVACVFVLRPSKGSGTYDNLIANGNFESLNDQGMPLSWYTDAYVYQGYTLFDTEKTQEGTAAHIKNLYANDARFAQTVAVSPDTLYCLKGYIKSDAQGGLGANLSIDGLYVFSQSVYDTQEEWQEIRLYGRTGKNQRSVTVFIRLGGYSGEATGEAWFDNITLNRVDSIPNGYLETQWFASAAPAETETESKGTGAIYLVIACLVYGGIFYLLTAWLRKERNPLGSRKNAQQELWLFSGMLAMALIIRVLVSVWVPGYDVDIGCFRAWAYQMANQGPAHFYSATNFCDYPPGYMWILWIIGEIGQLTGDISEALLKLPAALCDLALCILLYTEGKKYVSGKAALALSLLYAVNPLVLVTGSAWGQTDSIMTLLLVLTVFFALRSQWKFALPLYMVAVLVKPQALMFGPLGLAALIFAFIKIRKDKKALSALIRDVLIGLGALVITAAVIVIPFSIHQEWNWLITLYGNTMGQYGYATVNACNLYFLLGKNWVGAQSSLGGDFLLPLIAYLMVTLPLLLPILLKKEKIQWRSLLKKPCLRLYLLGGLALLLGLALLILGITGNLTYSTLGTCMIAYCVCLMIALYALGEDQKNLPLLGGVLLMMLYSAGPMMHERYLFPAVGLLLMAYYLKKDKRILWLALGISLSGLLNIGSALDRNIRIGGAEGHLDAPACGIDSDMEILEYLSAIGNCLLCGASLALSSLLCRKDAALLAYSPLKNNTQGNNEMVITRRSAPLPENAPLRKMTGRDYLIMGISTLLYAALAFTNLGSTKAPQTAWLPIDPEERITFDLGSEQEFNMLYFGGIHQYDSNFTVEVSEDGVIWRSYEAGMKIGDCFKWKYLSDHAEGSWPALLSGRYIRLTADHMSLNLSEVLFRNAMTDEVLPIVAFEDSLGNEKAAFLTDEQDTLEGEPGWYNSAYFDEIYHARTAFEHLHGLPPYETTHPPLGKVIMSWFVALYGMTPFGWRFAGALAGVLMLPGMYLLGKMLIKKKWGGLGAMMLMALDLMHFTQTRIATIDSFVVLFIIWSVYFMLRWFFLDYFNTSFAKTLVPLGLSGLFMGLSIASKWTGCYSAVGLALIFFFGMWRRYREVRSAKEIPEKKRDHRRKAAANGVSPLLITIGLCFIFFIAVPLIIYYLSYIPYFVYNGGVTVEKIIRAAEGMLSYHATPGLGMDHDFYSPWYQWPIIGKPMWYASSGFEAAGKQSSIMAMGNPAVWWTGLIGLMGVIFLWAKRHITQDRTLVLHAEKDDPRYALILICFAAQYLPWVLVPCGTYIYHYFTSVPFIILSTMLCLEWIAEKWEKAAEIALYALLFLALALFIAFFPYASGIEVSQTWMEMMKWFPRWLWY